MKVADSFKVDPDELLNAASPLNEIRAHISTKRLEQFAAMPVSRGLDHFLKEYRQHDLARLRGERS